MANEIIRFPNRGNSHKDVFTFPCGSTVTIEVPEDGPPLTVATAFYLLADAQFRIQKAMYE